MEKIISFRLDSKQIEHRRAARDFATSVLRPAAAAAELTDNGFPCDILGQMARHGFTGLDVPQQYGGQGHCAVTCCVILEELAAGWFSSTSYAAALSAGPVIEAGTEEQKRALLPGIAAGRRIAAFALTEPQAGSDAAAIKMTAKRVDEGFRISGTKRMITNAHIADTFIVYANAVEADGTELGVTVFLVDSKTPGVRLGRRFRLMAHNANPIWDVEFEECIVDRTQQLGPTGKGFEFMRWGFSKTRAFFAARCLGVGQAALDHAAHYATVREQFGRPLSDHQAIRFKLADMAARLEAARCLTYRSAQLVDDRSRDAPVTASMAKLVASQAASSVCSDAVQIMGGQGYMQDHPVERYYRESRLFEIGEGSSEMMRMIISRDATRRARAMDRVAIDD